MSSSTKKARAERLIGVIRDRAFRLLEAQRGEADPIAMTIDAAGRIGVVAVYDGSEFPKSDEALVGLQTELRIMAGQNKFSAAATAHAIRIAMPGEDERMTALCVQYEARDERPLRIYFPYTIRRKLQGKSEIDHGEPIVQRGTPVVFTTTV
ncbi:MAG: hypothetical protein NVSMB64_24860 [Candidatus Velthaea sp.]